jgi:hypothetical protein
LLYRILFKHSGETLLLLLVWMGMFVEAVNVDYHLSFHDQKKKLLFFVCRKHMEVCSFHFPFPFAANPRKLPFSVSSVFYIYITIYHHWYVKNNTLVPLTVNFSSASIFSSNTHH